MITLTREGNRWVVRSLLDIAAQGDSPVDALDGWVTVFAAQIEIDEKAGRLPLGHIPVAPARVWDRHWEQLSQIVSSPDEARAFWSGRPPEADSPSTDSDLETLAQLIEAGDSASPKLRREAGFALEHLRERLQIKQLYSL